MISIISFLLLLYNADTVSYKQMSWVAILPVDAGTIPLSKHNDLADDGQLNNSWNLVYPWVGGEKLVLSPQKFFVDGDNWFSDMSALGREVGIDGLLERKITIQEWKGGRELIVV